jgi:MFS transporter, SP family, solute carrier family 2 (myo-inositol transporter), member 13
MSSTPAAIARYRTLLLIISGMGGALYGYDLGIIGAALLYLDKSIALSQQQTELIVAAVLAGGTISCLLAGILADLFGRRTIALISAALFLVSVALICFSDSFWPLISGRLLQGLSAGMIVLVIPLYLAECLPAAVRGRGTAIFQLALTIGIMVAMAVGAGFSAQVDAMSLSTDQAAVASARDFAWRAMFATVAVPGLLFLAGCLFIAESPRWLQRHGRTDAALAALSRSLPVHEARAELAGIAQGSPTVGVPSDPLFQRRYILPFMLACSVLALNQATGINSLLQYVVVIMSQAGLGETDAANAGLGITAVNVLFTIVALFLVERKGRTFLLKLGTGGIIIALLLSAWVFHRFESQAADITAEVQAQVTASGLTRTVAANNGVPMRLTVLYDAGEGAKLVSVSSATKDPVLTIGVPQGGTLTIVRARSGPQPDPSTGWLAMGCFMLYIASFAVGPGVCVWLAMSELMPNRIRATGMGIALLLNQGVATCIAAVFLTTVGAYGYTTMFLAWGGATVVYFLLAAFVLPETKGRTLEDIEQGFAKKND